MLLKQTKSRFIFCSLILVLATLINGCNNSQKLAESLRADPSLESSRQEDQSQQSTVKPDQQSDLISQDQTKISQQQRPGIQIDKSPKNKRDSQTSPAKPFADLPDNLPYYPQANLKFISPQSSPEEGFSEWRSPDDPNTIVNYYREKWASSEWQIVQNFRDNHNKSGLEAIVRRDDLDFKIDLAIAKPTAADSQLETKLKISYQAANENQVLASKELKNTNSQDSDLTKNTPSEKTDPKGNNNQTATPVKNQSNTPKNQDSSSVSPTVPPQLLSYIQDVTALGITNSPDFTGNNKTIKFNPNETITRREYARWLFIANNKYYANVPGNKIRLASASNKTVFKDIRVQDSDFEEIQGLAEAGIIPSILTNDSSNIFFEPDDPLTREDLITWKVPLDTRRGLPKADANAIQEAWGFQDTNQIDVLALRALFADYQNGDNSNLKRVFGYTTLFQPKKVVTKAEAAASIWYFGFQGEGITAQDKLKSLKSSE